MSDLLRLHAGPLAMDFDVQNAFLRYIRWGQTEALRGIFAAVRDHNWNTIPTVVSDFSLQQTDDSFALSFVAHCRQDAVDFRWSGQLTGSQQGVVRFAFAGQALSTFAKNRIGLCVLHPSSCAGQTCEVEHGDGKISQQTFPRLISPNQPLKSIQALTHDIAAGLRLRVALEGEVFEMEDQRNWTDASFKTYCTPLDRPFPVEIAAGAQIHQTVTVELLGTPSTSTASVAATDSAPVSVQVAWDSGTTRPPIGFSLAGGEFLPTEAAVAGLRALQPSHVRADLRVDDLQWATVAARAIDLVEELGCQLEVAIHASEPAGAAWQQCWEWLAKCRGRVARILVFDPCQKTTPACLASAALTARDEWELKIPVVVGSDAYFAELNRQRPPIRESQVCYSINPQVHTFDNLSLCETLEAQRETVDSACAIFGGPVVVSPITLRPRFNPNATSVTTELPEPETDARQATGFVAAWTIGVLGQLATHPQVASLTFYETWGPRGVMAVDGEGFAVTPVFAEVLSASRVFQAISSRPQQISAVALLTADGRRRMLLGNMGSRPVEVCIATDTNCLLQAESVQVLDLETEL